MERNETQSRPAHGMTSAVARGTVGGSPIAAAATLTRTGGGGAAVELACAVLDMVVAEHVTRALARPGAMAVVDELAAVDVGQVAQEHDTARARHAAVDARLAVVAERHEVATGAELEVVADRGGGGGDLAERWRTMPGSR